MSRIPASEQIGTVLGGKYLLKQLLGEGGMGRVFAAEHTVIGRQVAVKVLHSEFARSPDISERFLREARAAGTIEHPGIIDVLDADRDESGTLYMVMELLKGESLATCLERKARLGPSETLAITKQILEALQVAHEHGVIHRDLKPDNIFLTTDKDGAQRVRILDFGISRIMPRGEEELRLTQTGTVMGTAYYMSPEQARGQSNVDHRADLWSMGVILYQMLSGVRPYRGDSYNAVMIAIAVEPVPPLSGAWPDIEPSLAAFVEKALQKDPDDRYGNVLEMLQALDRAEVDLNAAGIDDTRISVGPPPPVDAQSASSPVESKNQADVSTNYDRPPKDTDLSSPADAASSLQVGGFWRRAMALVLDLIVFGMVISTPLEAFLSDTDAIDVNVTAKKATGENKQADSDIQGDQPLKTKVSVSSVNITPDGIHVVGEDGDEVHIGKEGVKVREASGKQVLVGKEGIRVHKTKDKVTKLDGVSYQVKPSMATNLKISLWILYCTIFLTFFAATPGKMVLRLKVVQAGKVAGRLPAITALTRSAFFIISAFVAGLGCFTSLFNKERRTWHDRIARTVVIRSED